MIGDFDRVHKLWDRIEKYYAEKYPDYKLPPGATPADIHELETTSGVTLPEGFKASLLRHNGVERHWYNGELNSISNMLEETRMWLEVPDLDDLADGVTESGFLNHCWWDPKWLFFHADGAGNGSVLDMNPGPKGKVGQVIDFDHEVGPSGPLFACFEDYLEDVALNLEKQSS